MRATALHRYFSFALYAHSGAASGETAKLVAALLPLLAQEELRGHADAAVRRAALAALAQTLLLAAAGGEGGGLAVLVAAAEFGRDRPSEAAALMRWVQRAALHDDDNHCREQASALTDSGLLELFVSGGASF